MKKLLLATLILLVFGTYAWADYFQFMFRESRYYAAYAAVHVNGERIGYTDKYGRIAVFNLKNGTYEAEIRRRDRTVRVRLTIDGSRYMKRIYLD